MNPSTNGWIKKFVSLIKRNDLPYPNFESLYEALRAFGFIYGVNIGFTNAITSEHKLSEDEIAKINLITALYHTYSFHYKDFITSEFIESLLAFYKSLEVADLSMWDKLVIGKSKSVMLERLLHDRIQIDDNLITRNFNKSITSSLLFVDVLTYRTFLQETIDTKFYAAHLENSIVTTLYESLNSKENITGPDKKVVDIIESSKHIMQDVYPTNQVQKKHELNAASKLTQEEKQYLLDLVCLSVWDQDIVEPLEYNFLQNLGEQHGISSQEMEDSILFTSEFRRKHKKKILLFQQSNPINNFYENSSQLVVKLIRRNSKRLLKEMRQSKELMALITKSTHTDLTKYEQQKIQKQLIDILKTIPSLAIFILPGGAILLPLFAKLIPNMLPSAFDDNKIDD